MSKERKCANCGCICDSKEMYNVDNKYYCYDCMSACDNCGKLELLDNLTTVDVDTSREQRVCYGKSDTDYKKEYIQNLKYFAAIQGIDEKVIDYLLENGMSLEEIEEYIYER